MAGRRVEASASDPRPNTSRGGCEPSAPAPSVGGARAASPSDPEPRRGRGRSRCGDRAPRRADESARPGARPRPAVAVARARRRAAPEGRERSEVEPEAKAEPEAAAEPVGACGPAPGPGSTEARMTARLFRAVSSSILPREVPVDSSATREPWDSEKLAIHPLRDAAGAARSRPSVAGGPGRAGERYGRDGAFRR